MLGQKNRLGADSYDFLRTKHCQILQGSTQAPQGPGLEFSACLPLLSGLSGATKLSVKMKVSRVCAIVSGLQVDSSICWIN
jgi:hypothetical protein